jgi:hypothetical protein
MISLAGCSTITDDIASFAWTDENVQALHRAFSTELSREVRALGLEPFTLHGSGAPNKDISSPDDRLPLAGEFEAGIVD